MTALHAEARGLRNDLAELEEERRHRLGQGKDVSDLELIIADRSLDTGGDVKTLALEGQPLLTQNGEVAEGAIVPHKPEAEAGNEDPVTARVEITCSDNVTHRMLATQVKAFHEYFRPHYNPVENHMVWPPLSGEDWGRFVEDDSRLLRYLGDWEEFEHRKTQCRFWRDTILVEQETAVQKTPALVQAVLVHQNTASRRVAEQGLFILRCRKPCKSKSAREQDGLC